MPLLKKGTHLQDIFVHVEFEATKDPKEVYDAETDNEDYDFDSDGCVKKVVEGINDDIHFDITPITAQASSTPGSFHESPLGIPLDTCRVVLKPLPLVISETSITPPKPLSSSTEVQDTSFDVPSVVTETSSSVVGPRRLRPTIDDQSSMSGTTTEESDFDDSNSNASFASIHPIESLEADQVDSSSLVVIILIIHELVLFLFTIEMVCSTTRRWKVTLTIFFHCLQHL